MVFNSVEFLVFLIVVFFLYWFAGKGRHRLQSTILLVSSCIFYMFLIPEYILILFTTIIIDYVAGICIERTEGRRRKIYLIVSIISTCLVLFIFKYYDFFIHNFNGLASAIGWNYSIDTLKIMLPIGLSFHTFQSLSYVIEVYRRQQKAEKDFLIYSLYVMYFPQLVAGPIERAANLLPQFHKKPTFDEPIASEGMHQILWGLFKKVVVADACAVYANEAFSHIDTLGGGALFLGSVYFAIQIYCDFSGYSDIALGASKLFGIKLMTNFRFPYFSRDIAEFWRRWHISLSTWFRDYVYFPLGGSRVSGLKKFRNVLIIFLVSGFWHGANWTFVAWGGLHALFYLPVLYLGKNRNNLNEVAEGRWLPNMRELGQMLFTFTLVCFAWIFFRAPDIQTAISYCSNIFLKIGSASGLTRFLPGLLLVFVFLSLEWVNRANHNGYMFSHLRVHRNWILLFETIMIMMVIESYNTLDHEQFIYFQF
jgi:alginate O-acetyltransferase complex protein AlgI